MSRSLSIVDHQHLTAYVSCAVQEVGRVRKQLHTAEQRVQDLEFAGLQADQLSSSRYSKLQHDYHKEADFIQALLCLPSSKLAVLGSEHIRPIETLYRGTVMSVIDLISSSHLCPSRSGLMCSSSQQKLLAWSFS